jgi:hypothetical protein
MHFPSLLLKYAQYIPLSDQQGVEMLLQYFGRRSSCRSSCRSRVGAVSRTVLLSFRLLKALFLENNADRRAYVFAVCNDCR